MHGALVSLKRHGVVLTMTLHWRFLYAKVLQARQDPYREENKRSIGTGFIGLDDSKSFEADENGCGPCQLTIGKNANHRGNGGYGRCCFWHAWTEFRQFQ